MHQLLRLLIVLPTCSALTVWSQPLPMGTTASLSHQATMLFMENKGQLDPGIQFAASSGAMKIFLGFNTIHYQLSYSEPPQKRGGAPSAYAVHRFSVSLKNANPYPHIRKELESFYTENYFLSTTKTPLTNVHGYERVVFENVYTGIDWVVYTSHGQPEYDFIVHPGADPSCIQLTVENADRTDISPEGNLVFTTRLGTVTEKAPVSFDENGNKIETAFVKDNDGTIRFHIGSRAYKTLRIDPSISWATYYGDAGSDQAFACTKDAAGNVYYVGYTLSTANIASGGYQNTISGGQDAYMVKFNSAGQRVWATYYGGSSYEYGYACTVDNNGDIYLAGQTASIDGIAFGGFQNTKGGGATDGFFAKFNTAGGLIWASYFGGEKDEIIDAIACDANNNVFIGGSTNSLGNIATVGAHQTVFAGVFDGVVAKFTSAGARLWSTYYGSSGVDYGYAICTDNNGNVFLAGQTTSTTAISFNGWQSTYGGGTADSYLVKFDGNGGRQWGTYYGGNLLEAGRSILCDASNNVYMAGQTLSTSNIASNGFQLSHGGGSDAFLAKFDMFGSRLWGTYFGNMGDENANSCSIDANGNVYVVGSTRNSTTGIANGGFQNSSGGLFDGFVFKASPSGSLIWSSYFGGLDDDVINACVTDGAGNIYIAGNTKSTSAIATAGAYQAAYAGGAYDGFLVKISDAAANGYVTVNNGNWNNPATWLGGIVPDATSVVVINKQITVTADASCYSLTVNGGGTVTVNTGVRLTILH